MCSSSLNKKKEKKTAIIFQGYNPMQLSSQLCVHKQHARLAWQEKITTTTTKKKKKTKQSKNM